MLEPTSDILVTALVELVDQLQDAIQLDRREEITGLLSQIEWLVSRLKGAM